MHETDASSIQTLCKDNLVISWNHVDTIIVEDYLIILSLEYDSFHRQGGRDIDVVVFHSHLHWWIRQVKVSQGLRRAASLQFGLRLGLP